MRNMRLKKKMKRQQCMTRKSGPFRKVCEGLAIHPFIIRELVTPFRSLSPFSLPPLPSAPFLAALWPLYLDVRDCLFRRCIVRNDVNGGKR